MFFWEVIRWHAGIRKAKAAYRSKIEDCSVQVWLGANTVPFTDPAIPQLVGVFIKIFNQSLSGVAVPHCLKSSTIFPLLKKKKVVLKCLEKRFRIHFTTYLPLRFDPHQFIYKANRSMEDTFHSALFHLVHQGNYTRLLFVDFRSTFNTILLNRPVTKVSDLGVPYSICCCDVQGTT